MAPAILLFRTCRRGYMLRRKFISGLSATFATLASTLSGASACLTTLPPNPPFQPPQPYPNDVDPDSFLYGTDDLWTRLPVSGTWSQLPSSAHGYTQKIFLWSKGYHFRSDPDPDVIVTGRRLDGTAPSVAVSGASAANVSSKTPALITAVCIPTLGCWKFTAYYAGHSVTFAVVVTR